MNKKRLDFIKIFFIFVLPLILILRIFYIQIWKHNDLMPYVKKQIYSKINVNIPRGDIMDRNYKVLATSIEGASVYIYSKEFLKYSNSKSFNSDLKLLSSLVNIPENEIIERCEKEKYFCLIEELPLEEANQIKNIPGIEIRSFFKRIYPQETLFSYIIGKLDKEGKPYSGIEKEFDNFLSAIKNKELTVYKSGSIRRTSIRLTNLNDILEFTENDKNYSVILTIDAKLQAKLDKILKKYFSIFAPTTLICIVQDPTNGEIISLNILPEIKTPFINPAVNNVYEPGSVFKVFPLAVFLEEKVVSKDLIFDCENGEFEYNKIKIRDVKPHKFLNVEDIIVYSSNIGMSKMFLKFSNPQKFFNYINLFGFGAPTGIELPLEAKGFVPDVGSKTYSAITPLMVSFGQEISATPLQIVNAYSMIANGGELLQPYIVKSIVDPEGRIIYEGKKKVIRKIVSSETIKTIKEILYQTTKRGTARGTYLENVKICAKTGTAQKFDFELKKYSPTKYMMSCCGFFPMEEPKFVVGVFVDEPKKGSLASEVAVPIFKEVVLEILNYSNGGIKYAKKD